MPSLLTLPRDTWKLAKPYFTSDQKWTAWILLTAIVVMNLALVGMNVVLSYWNRAFYNSLQQKDYDSFVGLLMTYHRSEETGLLPGFVAIAVVYIIVAVYRTYLNQWLQISWRQWMTTHLLADWLADRAFYRISLMTGTGADEGTDNPDQRISEDIRDFVGNSLSIGLDLLSNVVTLFSFVFILWTLSGPAELLGVHIPGFMVWVALVYSVVGTLFTHWIGRPLIGLNFEQQKVEADFRFSLGRLRENIEGVALYRGEAQEKAGLHGQFAAITNNWWAIMRRTKLLNSLIAGYGQVSAIFPIVVAAPRFFAGTLDLGGLTQTAGAFGSVQGAMSFFVNSYSQLASLSATINRLSFFSNAIAAARKANLSGLAVKDHAGSDYRLEDVTLRLPNGAALTDRFSLDLPRGTSTVFTGRSGSGKSTLFRAFAGIWPFASGTLHRGEGTTLFLPQRPYFPLGTLREAVNYPGDAMTASNDDIRQALADVGLSTLYSQLDQHDAWGQRLSGGEQQRLAIARALLLKPEWLFLDEATAGLDAASETEVLRVLRERLPGTTIVSIAHRPDVATLHEREYVVRRQGEAAGSITPRDSSADPIPTRTI
jgi:putative ATP-binding cassette transporter